MKHKIMSMIVAPVFALIVTGCAKEPPKCSDQSTVTLIKQIIVEQLGGPLAIGRLVEIYGGRGGLTYKEVEENIKIDLPRASAYDEKIKKVSCEAELIAGDIRLPITYESQLDDKNQHVVLVERMPSSDILPLTGAIARSIQIGREAKTGGTTLQPKENAQIQQSIPGISGTWEEVQQSGGEMKIKPTAAGFDVELSVNSQSGCGGSLEGSGSLVNNILTLAKKEDNEVCTVTIKFSGDTADVDENNCSYYHGASCSFHGTFNRKK